MWRLGYLYFRRDCILCGLGVLFLFFWIFLRRCGFLRRNMRKMVFDLFIEKFFNVGILFLFFFEVNFILKFVFLSWSVCEELFVCVSVCVDMSVCVYVSVVWFRDFRFRKDDELFVMVIVWGLGLIVNWFLIGKSVGRGCVFFLGGFWLVMGDFVYYYREIEGGNLFFGRFCCCLFLVGLVLFLYLFLGCFEVLGSCCFFLLVILLLMFFDCILRIGVGVEFCLVFLLFWFGRLEKYFKSYYGDWI